MALGFQQSHQYESSAPHLKGQNFFHNKFVGIQFLIIAKFVIKNNIFVATQICSTLN